jgi:hypothetical protein
MGARGPQSSAALEIPSVADLRGDARPEPASNLTDDQAASGLRAGRVSRPRRGAYV